MECSGSVFGAFQERCGSVLNVFWERSGGVTGACKGPEKRDKLSRSVHLAVLAPHTFQPGPFAAFCRVWPRFAAFGRVWPVLWFCGFVLWPKGIILDVFVKCLGRAWDVFVTCLGSVRDVFGTCLGRVWDVFGTCSGRVRGVF